MNAIIDRIQPDDELCRLTIIIRQDSLAELGERPFHETWDVTFKKKEQ